MSEHVFSSGYADQYDLLYDEKDYEAECDLIEDVFHMYRKTEINKILDFGCGTGGHAIPLALRGYELTGTDRSPEMLSLARDKLKQATSNKDFQSPIFLQGDIRHLELGQLFDAVLLMFAVLSYQLSNDDVLATLHTVRRHLRPGGLFIGDFWYGPTVLRIGPSDRNKIINLDDGQLIRTASSSMNVPGHCCTVRYNLWRVKEEQLISHTQENHTMRYFFPLELEHFLNLTKLELLKFHPFPNIHDAIDSNTWNVLVCARAIT